MRSFEERRKTITSENRTTASRSNDGRALTAKQLKK